MPTHPLSQYADVRSAHRRPRFTYLLLGLGLLSAFLGPPSWGQGAGVETFTESIDVRVVNLEVVVTDRKGERVTGLGPDDFTLEVDREPMPIEYFSEVRDGIAIDGGNDGHAEAPGTAIGKVVPTRYLLFIDGAFGSAAGFNQLHRSMGEQIDRLEAHEQMAIVLYDGRELTELTPWTSSTEDLRRAMDWIDPEIFQGQERFVDYRSYQRSIADERQYVVESSVRGDPITPLADLPEYAVTNKRLERDVQNIARAARATLYRYADAGGRKVAILWSGGWPWNSREFLRPPWSRDLTSGARTEDDLRSIADSANRLGYGLYMADTSVSSYPAGTAGVQHHDTLDILARSTGGLAFKNFAGNKALESSRRDARSYYWLGFTAPGDGSGDRVKIKLKTTRRGLKVRSRENWLDLAPAQEVAQRIEATAFFGVGDDEEDDGGPPLRLDFGEPERSGLRTLLPVSVGIPLEGITMLPGPDGFHADLELHITVVDEDGRIKDLPPTPLQFSGREPKPGDFFYYETQLKMRKRQNEVTVTVHDVVSGAILVGREQLKALR